MPAWFAVGTDRLRTFSPALKPSLTLAITGSEKRCDEGAPLFTVRVDGVVMCIHDDVRLVDPHMCTYGCSHAERRS